MCRVFVSGRGNVFMREIAEHLVEGLVLAGRSAELVTARGRVLVEKGRCLASNAETTERVRAAGAALEGWSARVKAD